MTGNTIQYLSNSIKLLRQHIIDTGEVRVGTFIPFKDIDSHIVLLHRNLDTIEEALKEIFKEHNLS